MVNILNLKILTNSEIKKLSDIKINDLVLSYNETTKKYEYNKVVEIIEKEIDELYEITIDNEVIKVSNTHPFYNGKEYVKVSNLKIKDKVLGLDNKYYEIRKINKKEEKIKEINITVENNHNYFVGKGYLVHNYGSHSSGSSRSYGGGGGGGGGRDDAAAAAEAARQRRIAETKAKIAEKEAERAEVQRQNVCYANAVIEFRIGTSRLSQAVGGQGFDSIVSGVAKRAEDAARLVNETAEQINALDREIDGLYSNLAGDGCFDKRGSVPKPRTASTYIPPKTSGEIFYNADEYEKAINIIKKGIGFFDDANSKVNRSKYSEVYDLTKRLEDARKEIEEIMLEFDRDINKLNSDHSMLSNSTSSSGKIDLREHFDNAGTVEALTSVLDQVTDPKILELISSAFSLLGNMEGTSISKVVYSKQDRFNIRDNGQLALDCSGFVTYLFNKVYGDNIPEYANTGTMSQGRVELKLINEDNNHKYDPDTGQMTVKRYRPSGQSYTEVYDAYPYTGDDGKTHYAILEKSYASGQPKSHTYYNYPFEALDENQTPQAGDIYMDGRNHVRIYLGSYDKDGSDDEGDYYIEVHEDANGVQVVKMSGGRDSDGSYTGTLVSHIGSHRDCNVGNMGYDSQYYRYTGESSITHNSSDSGTEVLQEFSTN